MTAGDLKIRRGAMGFGTQRAAANLVGYRRPYYAEFGTGTRPIPDNLAMICAAH